MRYLLDVVYLILVPFVLLLARKSRGGLWRRFLGRAGAFGWPLNKRVWFHGVSVGEIHLLHSVIARFRIRHPQIECVVSSTTDTGFDEARKCFADLTVIRWPLDFSWAVDRALREVRPDLVVLAESELWPNFLHAARRRGIPVVAINVRLSPRSANRYRRIRSLARRWLGLVDHFAVQTEDYATLLQSLGVESRRITVTGSVKYDGVRIDAAKTAELRRLFDIRDEQLVWIAGSTQEPEEQIVLETYQRLQARYPNLRLIIVPRQRDGFDAVAELLHQSGVSFVRRSELVQQRAHVATLRSRLNDVVLVDTIGELSAIWGLADIAFVGGSLDGRRGGQNMIEPAACGAAVVFGQHAWNFRDTVSRLLEAGAAMQVRDAAELEAGINRLLADPDERRRLGVAARRLVRSQQGATERTLATLDRFLVEERSQVA